MAGFLVKQKRKAKKEKAGIWVIRFRKNSSVFKKNQSDRHKKQPANGCDDFRKNAIQSDDILKYYK